MTIQIDKAGRVVLPKQIRDRLGMTAGSDLEVVETLEGLMLKKKALGASVGEVEGHLLYLGDLPAGFDVVQAIEQDREERDRRNLGLQ